MLRRGAGGGGTSTSGEETTERNANRRQRPAIGQSCKWSLKHGIKKHLPHLIPPPPPPPFHLASCVFFFLPPPDHSGRWKKTQMFGARADTAGVTGFSRCQCLYPYCCAFLQKNIMSRLKRVSVFWLRCKMYCHYCLFHSCLAVIENMQSNVGHVYPNGSLHTSVHTSNASRATTSKFMTGYGRIYYGGGGGSGGSGTVCAGV